MHNLEYIGKRLFGLEWEDLNEQDRKTCAIVEQREYYWQRKAENFIKTGSYYETD